MAGVNSTSAQIGTLVFATSLIQIANGFFGTFFSLRVTLEDFEASLTGLVLSAYFAGFTVGAFFCGRIIARLGHIRAYAAFAGVVAAATGAMSLYIGPVTWLGLRLAIGFGCAGLFIATESWLNAKASPATRGRVFSIYMVGTFAALGLGQLLIGWTQIEASAPFSIIMTLFAIALVVVSMTKAEQPQARPEPKLSYKHLPAMAPVAVAAACLSGLITGAFYALIPAWMLREGIGTGTIGVIMLSAVFGGLAFQVPVGWLSDRFDRRVVLSALGIGLGAAAVLLARLPHTLPVVLPVVAVIGGLMSTIYPIGVAHAHDRMPADRVVAVSSQLILLSGCGSMVGPLVGTILMRRFEVNGVLYLMASAAFLLSLVALTRILVAAPPRRLERTFDILSPQAAPLAHEAGSSE